MPKYFEDVATTPNTSTQFTLSSLNSGNFINMNFNSLPGNMPQANGNYQVIWKNLDQIPWNDTNPDQFAFIENQNSQGSQAFNVQFQVGIGYVIGYGVGPKLTGAGQQLWGNVCSYCTIPKTGTDVSYFYPSITMGDISANSLTANLILPNGITPGANGAWVGLWNGEQTSWVNQPVNSNAITSPTGCILNGLNLVRGNTYSLGVFMSGYQAGAGKANILTAKACVVDFSV